MRIGEIVTPTREKNDLYGRTGEILEINGDGIALVLFGWTYNENCDLFDSMRSKSIETRYINEKRLRLNWTHLGSFFMRLENKCIIFFDACWLIVINGI